MHWLRDPFYGGIKSQCENKVNGRNDDQVMDKEHYEKETRVKKWSVTSAPSLAMGLQRYLRVTKDTPTTS